MTYELEELYNLIETQLVMQSPILSGNMQKGIRITSIGDNEITIEIEAKFYDMQKWKKDKVIQHTGKTIGGKTDYAYWVNELGGFATGNESMHWVNRVLNECANVVVNEVGGEVINELEL